ncbi:TonB-dependent receptor plug domain-containing protein [Psychroflexus sp. ALD_RP9]|uniref:TonB-dependent receptor plug domain-containing protein n=1 Tax=Psychroflexus sp. ALD_RP9 TaxID=2777186 RepID=UPI001A8FBD1D|nr:TonB-dependent receptor plug domain-containing protein [Psychroflexus sp. ALD_RP9]QSS96535.1 TonB-dependent receptor [Psychroflexus sp. ALD_RP9]
MKQFRAHIFVCLCLVVSSALAQLDSIQQLDEIVLSDRQLQQFSVGQNLIEIPKSKRRITHNKLSDLLLENSNIHIRQNGYGMVASASFRGTTAQQTAVVWNGININSQFNGQTDFSTMPIYGYSEISLRPGGGSLLYGSGAIGGSIHLNNQLYFRDTTQVKLFSQIGSFNTFENFVQTSFSTERTSLKFNLNRSASDNDYPILGSSRTNLNGQFEQWSAHLSLAHKLSQNSQLNYYGQFYDGIRHFSVLRASENKSNYTNIDSRNLLEWEYEKNDFKSVVKYAFLHEAFEYNQNIETNLSTANKANTHLVKTEVYQNYGKLNTNFNISAKQTSADGDNIINEHIQHLNLSALLKYNSNWAILSLGLRQEFSNFFDSPLLYTIGAELPVTSIYNLKLSHSKNFRQPTLNDLFWVEGTTNLQPETALQYEASHQFNFKPQSLNFQITGFYNDISEMIRWLPDQTSTWKPENVDEVKTYGLNTSISKTFKFLPIHFKIHLNYEFSKAIDARTQRQLTFTPQHSAYLNLDFQYEAFALNFTQTYTGKAFTRTDNAPNEILEDFWLSHLNLAYQPKRIGFFKVNIGFKNLFNQAYQTIENRPMPGRQFYINTIINL